MSGALVLPTAQLLGLLPPHTTPVPSHIPESHKVRILTMDDEPFRFMALPDELRLKIYRLLLPMKEKIILDPEEIGHPSCYADQVVEDYGETLDMMLTCKKMHTEVTEFVYTHNTITIVNPLMGGRLGSSPFLEDLGVAACRFITKLEVKLTSDIGEMGNSWSMMNSCPKLEDLRLVFYHDKVNWSRTLAQLVCVVTELDDDSSDPVINDLKLPQIEVELHTSIWVRRPLDVNEYYTQFNHHQVWSRAHQQVFSFAVPDLVRRITITASVSDSAADALEMSQGGLSDTSDWCFKRQLERCKDGMKVLRLEKAPMAEISSESSSDE